MSRFLRGGGAGPWGGQDHGNYGIHWIFGTHWFSKSKARLVNILTCWIWSFPLDKIYVFSAWIFAWIMFFFKISENMIFLRGRELHEQIKKK